MPRVHCVGAAGGGAGRRSSTAKPGNPRHAGPFSSARQRSPSSAAEMLPVVTAMFIQCRNVRSLACREQAETVHQRHVWHQHHNCCKNQVRSQTSVLPAGWRRAPPAAAHPPYRPPGCNSDRAANQGSFPATLLEYSRRTPWPPSAAALLARRSYCWPALRPSPLLGFPQAISSSPRVSYDQRRLQLRNRR